MKESERKKNLAARFLRLNNNYKVQVREFVKLIEIDNWQQGDVVKCV